MREVDEQRAVVSALREENARVISEAEEGQREKKGYVERIEQLEGKVKSLKTECKRLEEERDRMVLEVDRNEEELRELEKRLENEKIYASVRIPRLTVEIFMIGKTADISGTACAAQASTSKYT